MTTRSKPPALLSEKPATLAFRIGQFLGHGRHAAALGEILGRPISTARSWTNGRRKMPAYMAKLLAERLRAHAAVANALADDADYYALREERKPRLARGWQVIRERDGPGPPPRDARWRHGRPRRP